MHLSFELTVTLYVAPVPSAILSHAVSHTQVAHIAIQTQCTIIFTTFEQRDQPQ